MRVNVRSAGTALAAGTMLMAVTAAPAAAAGKASLAHAKTDVRAADSALVKLKLDAKVDSPAAIKLLALGRTDLAAAAHQARWMNDTASASTTASAFADVAVQADVNVQAYASLLGSTTGAVQAAIAQALVPVMALRTEALGFLGDASANLSVSAATNATGTLTSVIGNGPAEIATLNGVIDAGVSANVQPVIAQAVVTAGGVLGTSLSEVEGIVTSLPATVQPIVEGQLTGMIGALGNVKVNLDATAATCGALSGGTITSEVGQVTSVLDGILGQLPNLGDTVTGGTGVTATGGTGVTATGGAGVTATTGTGVTATTDTGTGVTATSSTKASVDVPPFLAKVFTHLGVSVPAI